MGSAFFSVGSEYIRLKFLREVGLGSSASTSFSRKSDMFTQPYVLLPPMVARCGSTLMILPVQHASPEPEAVHSTF